MAVRITHGGSGVRGQRSEVRVRTHAHGYLNHYSAPEFLAIAPLPRSLVAPPYARIDSRYGLPTLGNYHILLLKGAEMVPATEALAGQVTESLAA